jgi:hypothetical protein
VQKALDATHGPESHAAQPSAICSCTASWCSRGACASRATGKSAVLNRRGSGYQAQELDTARLAHRRGTHLRYCDHGRCPMVSACCCSQMLAASSAAVSTSSAKAQLCCARLAEKSSLIHMIRDIYTSRCDSGGRRKHCETAAQVRRAIASRAAADQLIYQPMRSPAPDSKQQALDSAFGSQHCHSATAARV